jgi:probable HAF family extracellular repeat protein
MRRPISNGRVPISRTARFSAPRAVRAALAAVTALLVVAGGAQPLHAQTAPETFPYEVVDLGTFGGELANAFSINNSGDVVGRAEDAGRASKGFLWRDGELIDIGGLSSNGSGTTAYAINDKGEIVGSSLAPDPQLNGRSAMPFYWSEVESQPDSFTRAGTIEYPSPAGVGATRAEFTAACPAAPNTQGLDGYVFTLPDVQLEDASIEVTAANATSTYALRAATWAGDCTAGDEVAAAPGETLTHTLAEGTRYVLVSTDSGLDTSLTLEVTPAPAKILNLGQDLTRTGTGTARDVNNSGLAVGVWRRAAFTWSRAGGYSELPFLPNAYWDQAEAMAVNDAGVIVGWGTDDKGFKKPVRWSGGTIEQLPVLAGGNYGVVNDVSSAGVMAGEADGTTDRGLRPRPVLWHADGRIEEIPLAPLDPPLDMGFAEGINDRGTVIGWDMSSIQGDGRQVAWIRDAAGVKTDLNELIDPASGWDLRVPLDINEREQIVGIGILTVGGVTYEGRAFLLNPTDPPTDPERTPTALDLLVEGRGTALTLTGRLADVAGAAVAGRTLTFYSDGEALGSGVTDAAGAASVEIPPGHRGANRTYSAVFAGDTLYEPSSATRSRP